MTKKTRKTIAKAIKTTVITTGVAGLLFALSGLAVIEDFAIPMWVGVAECALGIFLTLFSLYAYYKIYIEEDKK